MKFLLSVLSLFSLEIVLTVNSAIIKNGITCKDKKIIIDYHNELRTMLANGTLSSQPKAANMQKMVWDDKLQIMAQNWADNMLFKHNPSRKDDRFSVGENLYISYIPVKGNKESNSSKFHWTDAIKSWFDEQKDYTYKPLVSDPKTGHYTQVIWHNTIYVGCGATYYDGQPGRRNKIYVCDYAPAGNYIGDYPYETGNGCENLCCDSQCDTLYGNYCSA